MTTPVWISLGSNLGDRRAIIEAALNLLNQTPGVVVSQISSFRETQPVGGPPGQGPFLNAAARLETILTPRELLGVTQGIENELGRVRTVRWGERTLDLDLLIFGSKFVDEPDLKLPHPRLAVRRFVLEPLAEIAPDVVDTMTHQRVDDLLANLDRRPRLLMLDTSVIRHDPRMHLKVAECLNGQPISLRALGADPSEMPPRIGWERHHDYLGKLETLRLAWVGGSIVRDDWSVCNFAFHTGDFQITNSASFLIEAADLVVKSAVTASPRLWFQIQFARRQVDLPYPTMTVTCDASNHPRKPGCGGVPIYRPEATDPVAIVAEVVAVCRGIEGV